VVSLSGEGAVGQRDEVASQVRLVGETEFGSKIRPIELTLAQPHKYMLEANDATKLLGREADSVSKLPFKLPPTEQGVLKQLLHANVTRVALNGGHSPIQPGQPRICAPCMAHMLFQRSHLCLNRSSLVQLRQQVIASHFAQAIQFIVSIGQAVGFGLNQAAQARRLQAHTKINGARLRGKQCALCRCAEDQHLTPRVTKGEHDLYAAVGQHLERVVRGGAERIVAEPEAVNDATQRW